MQEHNGGALARLDDMNPTTAAGFDHSTLRRGGTDHPPMDVEHLIGACAGPVSRRVTSSNGFSSRPEPSAPGHPVALASAVLSLEPVTRGALHRRTIAQRSGWNHADVSSHPGGRAITMPTRSRAAAWRRARMLQVSGHVLCVVRSL